MRYLKSKDVIIKNENNNDFIELSKVYNLEKNHRLKVFASEGPPETSLNISAISTFYSFEEEQELAKTIWKRLQKGDIDALGELYDLYVDELFSYGMEKVYNRTRVMDGIHDLFVDLYKYRSNIAIPANVKYYLLKSLKRKVYRKQTHKQNINLEDSFLETKKFNPDLSREEEIIDAERAIEKKNKVKIALTFLTNRQQKALHLKFTENRTYSEIAEAMNISIATSRTVVYRALSTLRKHCVALVITAINLFL